ALHIIQVCIACRVDKRIDDKIEALAEAPELMDNEESKEKEKQGCGKVKERLERRNDGCAGTIYTRRDSFHCGWSRRGRRRRNGSCGDNRRGSGSRCNTGRHLESNQGGSGKEDQGSQPECHEEKGLYGYIH